ncbi:MULTISPECIES: hypothetical protein [Streptomyces]|uniref:Uncharacterized protein n=1 Tax=Streptomyces melanosporofaciens TaxID=67327 RepID=A0A1H4VLW5_STRMJ|nr:hypothetical protein [Streptomyces melanosporofaciens]SEC81568.1 hypothetical protein SAMN04490356_5635 [Streptomyces melanosporofaciens]
MKKAIRVVVLGASVACALLFGGVNVAQAQKWPVLPMEFFGGLTGSGTDQRNACESRFGPLGAPGTSSGGSSSTPAQPAPAGGLGSDCQNTRG